VQRLTIRTLFSHVRRRKLRAQLALRQLIRECSGPVPLDDALTARNKSRTPDALEPHPSGYLAPGRDIGDHVLSEWLGEEELGMWTMAVDTLEALGRMVAARRPALIMEFGSGVSTLCLGQFMRTSGCVSAGPAVISIEQSQEYAQKTRDLLSKHGLSDVCDVLHAPLQPCEFEGEASVCYAIDGGQLSASLGERGVDLLVVDGPAGDRFPTALSVAEFLSPKAMIVLDDAWRDAELEVARRWALLPWLRVEGILPVGKGLLVAETVEGGDR